MQWYAGAIADVLPSVTFLGSRMAHHRHSTAHHKFETISKPSFIIVHSAVRALLTIKNSIIPPQALPHWTAESGTSVCDDWQEIRCDATGHVTKIAVRRRWLYGSLDTSGLSDLPKLEEL